MDVGRNEFLLIFRKEVSSMTIKLIRTFFLVLSAVCGYYIGSGFTGLVSQKALLAAGIGLTIGAVISFLEAKMKSVSLRNLSAAAFGLAFGFFMAWMITLILRLLPMEALQYSIFQIVFTLIFCYLGMVIAIKGKDEFNVVIPYVRFSREDQRDQRFLLDTSVIIDGRISGICETAFLQGKVVVPRFVLHELQQIADSADDGRRRRGRRGLDILDRLKQIPGIEIIIHEEGLSEIKEVDAKLVRMAKILDCPVLTNDFNLNKVAKLEGVEVLNINDLANAMRPVVFPGEQMEVQIRKEGKERDQGVAFLDDGTMIVVDNSRQMIGKRVRVTISSVLQTSAGRMIFAALNEKHEQKRPAQKRPEQKRSEQRRPRNNRQQKPRDRQENKPQAEPQRRENKPQTEQPQRQENKPQAEQPQRQENKPQTEQHESQDNKPQAEEHKRQDNNSQDRQQPEQDTQQHDGQ